MIVVAGPEEKGDRGALVDNTEAPKGFTTADVEADGRKLNGEVSAAVCGDWFGEDGPNGFTGCEDNGAPVEVIENGFTVLSFGAPEDEKGLSAAANEMSVFRFVVKAVCCCCSALMASSRLM